MFYLLVVYTILKVNLPANGQTWSTWTSCSLPETCNTKTELICDNGRGIQCSQYGASPYQIALSAGYSRTCDGFDNKQWRAIYTFPSCRGNCYDSIIVYEYNCKTNLASKRYLYHRCYKEETCRGIWKESSSQCSSSCGGGTRTVITTCFNQTTWQQSKNCNGTFYGTNNQINTNRSCNTHACPTWSSWSEVTTCSLSCGRGTQTSASTCMYNGMVSNLCESNNMQNRTRQSQCNIHACPTWSSWSELTSCSESCGGGTIASTSTCMYNGTASNLCEGNNIQNRIRQSLCNIQSCPTWSPWSELTSCSVSCGNGTQNVISTCIYDGIVSVLCKDSFGKVSRSRLQDCNYPSCRLNHTVDKCEKMCSRDGNSNLDSHCQCNSKTNETGGVYAAIAVGVLILNVIICIVLYKKRIIKCKILKQQKSKETGSMSTYENVHVKRGAKTKQKLSKIVAVQSNGEFENTENNIFSTNAVLPKNRLKAFSRNEKAETPTPMQAVKLEDQHYNTIYETMNCGNEHQTEYENLPTINQKPR